MFALAEEGHASLFEQLVACILSIRTLAQLSARRIDQLIGDTSFHTAKAEQIKQIARRAADQYGEVLPCDSDVIRSFRGVGPKCAHLALGIACGERRISVDIHVHRVTNRWGYVQAPTPERTMAALEQRLPAGGICRVASPRR